MNCWNLEPGNSFGQGSTSRLIIRLFAISYSNTYTNIGQFPKSTANNLIVIHTNAFSMLLHARCKLQWNLFTKTSRSHRWSLLVLKILLPPLLFQLSPHYFLNDLLLLFFTSCKFFTLALAVILMLPNFFSSQARFKYLSFFSFSLIFTQWSAGTESSLFLLIYHKICSSGWDYVICLYLEIPENFVRFNLQDGFWFVHIPFGSMVKFQFLAQFPVDHQSYLVVSSLILLLR